MYLEKCSESQLKTIYQEFNITEESLKRDVNYLMEWMEKQPHLPNVKDEDWISHTLIQCKNSIEKTKRLLDSYYCVKALLPVLFTNRDPTGDAFKMAFNLGIPVPLPKLTPEGYRICFYRNFSDENVNLLTPDLQMKMTFMNMDVGLKGDLNQKLIFIYDYQNLNMSLATTLFTGARKHFSAFQTLYSFRIHQVHIIINLNPTLTTFLNISKGFMKKKLVDRMVIWNNEKPDLTTMFPAEILPEDYGGKEKPLKQLHEMYYQYVCEFREWLISGESVKADLSKRTDDLYKISMDDSVNGSFRQLIID